MLLQPKRKLLTRCRTDGKKRKNTGQGSLPSAGVCKRGGKHHRRRRRDCDPSWKRDSVIRPGLAAMVVKDGVDFDALDGEPVHLIFLIAAPNTRDNIHLDVLSKLSTLLMDETFVQNLQNASTVEEFLKIVDKADEEKPDLNEQLASQTLEDSSGKVCRIVAVTSCPTGIAHTYMAAEGLEKAARKKNCRIKVETRGSGGAKNVLTETEIEEADCVIVAADAQCAYGEI